jgi:energy-coupling factor transport system permease protein
MSFVAPLARSDAPLARRNPVAKLLGALALTLFLLSTLDPVAPAVALAVELAAVPLFGLRYRDLARRAWPLWLAVAGILFTILLFGTDRSGLVLIHLGPFSITTGLLLSALGLALRLLAISLPGFIVFATTDPTDLADALVQNAKAPPRFAIGTLAAFRLLPLLGDEWRMLSLARRARGVDAGRNPVAALRLFVSTMFGLLVGAIRRGTRLAAAMDARGFDSTHARTVAREQRFTVSDALFVSGALALGAVCVAISVAIGTFTPLLA